MSVPGRAGVVDQHIEPAVALEGGGDQADAVRLSRHVGGGDVTFAAQLAHQVGGRLEPLDATRPDQQPGAIASVGERQGPTDAGARPGDQHHPSVVHVRAS